MTRLPALSQSPLLRYITFPILYVAQGLPYGLVLVALPAWLAKQGLGTAEIGGFTAIVALPWSLKLIGGPLMDRFCYLPMGRRRPWVVGAQIGLFISFCTLAAVPDPAYNLTLLAAIGFVTNMCAAFQDVAVDGMAIDVVPEDQRARANGFMFGGQGLGIAFSTGVGGTVMSSHGLGAAIALNALFLAVIVLFPICLRERPGEKLLPWTEGTASPESMEMQLHSWGDIFRSLFRVVVLPASLIGGALNFLYRGGEGITWTVIPVLTIQELGWQDADYSQIQAYAGVASSIVGMVVGATLVHWLGGLRCVLGTVILMIVVQAAAGIFTDLWYDPTYVTAYFFALNILGIVFVVSIIPVFMTICWKKVAATQFSLYMALANLGTSAGAAVTGPIDAVLEYNEIFLATAALGIVLIVLTKMVRMDRHAERLEEIDAETAAA